MEKIDLLHERKRELEVQLADISRVILAYEDLEREMLSVLGKATPNAAPPEAPSSQARPSRPAPTTRQKSSEVEAFERAVRKILSEAVKPVDRSELLNDLRIEGIEVGGAEPLNTLGARIFRMKDTVAAKRGSGYFLRARESEFFPRNERIPTEDVQSLKVVDEYS